MEDGKPVFGLLCGSRPTFFFFQKDFMFALFVSVSGYVHDEQRIVQGAQQRASDPLRLGLQGGC